MYTQFKLVTSSSQHCNEQEPTFRMASGVVQAVLLPFGSVGSRSTRAGTVRLLEVRDSAISVASTKVPICRPVDFSSLATFFRRCRFIPDGIPTSAMGEMQHRMDLAPSPAMPASLRPPDTGELMHVRRHVCACAYVHVARRALAAR